MVIVIAKVILIVVGKHAIGTKVILIVHKIKLPEQMLPKQILHV